MVVGVLRLELLIPDARSLKAKRRVVRAVTARVRNKFNVSVAECGAHDLWKRSVIGVAQVGSDEQHVDACLRTVTRFIEDLQLAPVGEEALEFLHYGHGT
jgi:uncharacterized protein YlxP (DUF503 family)